MNWTCPHCDHKVTITPDRESAYLHVWTTPRPAHGINTIFYQCPNSECKKITIHVQHGQVHLASHQWQLTKGYETTRLVPGVKGRTFPDYIPQPITEDYQEACSIQDLSPKASATLARRCLQGILRDFWKVKPGRLVDEIAAIREKVEPDVWAAIDSVRKIGNIGAHMEKDINQIVEVDSGEARILLELIEMLIDEWYIARHIRQTRLRQIVEIAESKG